ncbi:MAG: hypothetical protein J5787_00740 [Alphaproteobacteria bacterium]|nr:hypothetical protein [Alphaproteobacteria bacterium]MBO4644464.1 hypothetical protein [Alphaproteobacteria bacterium]
MKKEHHCHCKHGHEHGEECRCGHHHDHCECEHEDENENYSAVSAMFGLDTDVPEDALSLLQTEMDECDELSELLGLGDNPDVDEILQDAIEDLTPKKKKTLMNLAVILHDYLPEE